VRSGLHHPCEGKCRRAQLDQAIAICELKRFAADYELENPIPVEKPEITKDTKVAIVGAGPAGLTAAYYLAQLGHDVTVFEALPKPGGYVACWNSRIQIAQRHPKCGN